MMIGLALTPFFMMGLALTPGFFLGACTYTMLFDYGACHNPLFRIWFHVLQPKKRKKSQSQRGLSCAFEYYIVDGV
jgi:hypothetical protein